MVVLTSFTQPTDGIRHRQQNTVVYVNENNLGKGTLYIAESRLSWIGEAGNGFSIEYPHISLHAISRDLSAFPQECLFLMLDTSLGDEDQSNGQEEDDDGNDSSTQETTEMRLVPDDRGMLDAMFHAMNACQAMHPDPEDSFSDEDFFEDADDEIPMEEADSQMARLRIGNMDGRAHIGGRVEDMVEDRVVGRLGGIIENRALGTGVGMGEDILEGMGEDTLEGMGEDMVGDTLEGMGEDTVGDTLEGMGEDTVGDTLEGTVGGTVEDMVAGTAGGILEGKAEGTVADRAVGTVGGTVEDTVEDTLAGTAAGTAEGTVVDMMADVEEGMGEGISPYTRIRTAQGGRSFFLGNKSHRDRTADFPVQQSTHMVLDSNFDDAEN